MKNTRWLITFLSFFLLVGCIPTYHIDSDLIDTNTCVLPCWNGITPNVTSKDEATKILKKMESDGIGILSVQPDSLSFRSDSKQRFFILDNEKVKVITVASINNTTLGDLIKYFGEPSRESGIRFVGEPIITIYYFEKGLAFTVILETNVPATVMYYPEPKLPLDVEFNLTQDSKVIIAYMVGKDDKTTFLRKLYSKDLALEK